MSIVTNVILTTLPVDRINVIKLNELNEVAQNIYSFAPQMDVVSCDATHLRWYGGDVLLGMNICIGAMNGLELEKMVLAMRQIPWVAPDSVQLLVAEQDDERFVEVDWQRSTAPPAEDRIQI